MPVLPDHQNPPGPRTPAAPPTDPGMDASSPASLLDFRSAQPLHRVRTSNTRALNPSLLLRTLIFGIFPVFHVCPTISPLLSGRFALPARYSSPRPRNRPRRFRPFRHPEGAFGPKDLSSPLRLSRSDGPSSPCSLCRVVPLSAAKDLSSLCAFSVILSTRCATRFYLKAHAPAVFLAPVQARCIYSRRPQ